MDKNYEYVTSCPHCGFPADVDMSIVLTSHPPQYRAWCKQKSCEESFTVFANEIMKKEIAVLPRSSGKSTIVEQKFGKQALHMKSDEVMINKGNYAVIRRLPESIDSILEKNEVFEKIMDLYIFGREEYETSERHTLDMFRDDVFDILENYLEEK